MEKSEVKDCVKCTKKFLVIPQEKTFYERKKLPLPKVCPTCRRDRRRSLRNERTLYKRTCDKCSAEVMSTYPKDSPYVVYCEKCYLNMFA
ncbi:zinc-ribbon domain containing protein [Patescibacteria group bacterium]